MSTSEEEIALKYLDPNGYYENFIKHDIRPNGREIHNIRTPIIKKSSFNNTNCCGSSYIELGNTKVSCGVKLLIGTPSLNKPNCGDVEIDISLWQICSPKYDQKSKSDIALILESQLYSLVMDTKMFDLEQLCIQEGKAAFRLCISIVLLSDAGNLFDVMVLSLVSALNDIKLPNTIIDENSGTISISEEFIIPLILSKNIISITVGIFNDIIITDLDEKEEQLMYGFITIVFDEYGNICYMNQNDQRQGLCMQTIQSAISLCHQKSIELRKNLS